MAHTCAIACSHELSSSTVLLKRISLLPERISDWSEYPFNVPTIASLRELEIEKPVVLFVGENSSGKSTLLEAIAVQYGFGPEGGNRNFSSATTDSVRSVDPLVKALRIVFSRRTGRGFFLRAESFFNTASAIDALGTAMPTVAATFTPSRTANLSSHWRPTDLIEMGFI